MPSVTLAFSVFWLIEALICSMEALVSSTLAACSLEPWLSDCAVALTSSEALDRLSAALRTSVMICESFSTMFFIASSSMPVSSREVTSMRTAMSPSARRLATKTASLRGFVMLRTIQKAMPKANRKAATAIDSVSVRACWYSAAAASPSSVIRSPWNLTRSLTRMRYSVAAGRKPESMKVRASSPLPSSTSLMTWFCAAM